MTFRLRIVLRHLWTIQLVLQQILNAIAVIAYPKTVYAISLMIAVITVTKRIQYAYHIKNVLLILRFVIGITIRQLALDGND